ncbi:flagellar basal-body MS-ring/collar protein FliF [Rhodospirillaceae bacterium SYSU D60014]|uniref:flagellar basal-body MS-ring/collar protein FliF n=1 Tax=Virgifigura deserti TaxID=2268457 RepID=UPI000E663515
MNAFFQTLRNLGPLRLSALGGIGLVLAAFFIYLTARLSSPDMALLYGELQVADSSQIVSRLEAMGVPYELRREGTEILVPTEKALRLRMTMAEEGLPSGGSVGYEIFDRADSLGTTSFVQEVNRLRALEGELARTIRTISQVKSARVHLVIPERELFSRDKPEPSASIILVLDRRATLEKPQVLAIQHLVAAAVPGLKPASISIVDNNGTLLARGTENMNGLIAGSTADEMRIAYENRTTRMIEELVQRSLGYGNVRAEVSAEMDFDRITTNSETYDPEGQVVRSTQYVEEQASSTDGDGQAPVTVGNNLPDPNLGLPGGSQSTSQESRIEETTNYEISKTVQTHVREAGLVRRLSVAVLVDGTYETTEDGSTTYVPRGAEELQKIETLVRSAVGYNAERGDTVEIVNMRFSEAADNLLAAEDTLFFGLGRDDLMQMLELGVVGVIAALFLLLVVRPMLMRLFDAEAENRSEVQGLLTDESELPPALAPPAASAVPAVADPDEDLAREIDQMIDINQIEGRVRASSLRKISEIVEKHPEEAVNIMRGWMYQQS